MPPGGIVTGCVDLNTDGSPGSCSIFHSFVPPGELKSTLLELTLSGKPSPLRVTSETAGLSRGIRYWGLCSVADLEYQLEAPVSVNRTETSRESVYVWRQR